MAAQRQRSQLAALISPPSRGGRRAQASGGGGGGGGAGGGGYVSDPGPVSPVLSPKSYKTLRQELMEERKRQHESVERERQALNAMLREHTDNMRRARASLEEERMQLHRTLTQRKFEEEDMKDIELDQLRLQQTAGEATLLLAMQGRLLLARRQPFQPPPPKQQQSTPPRSSIDGNNSSTSFLPDIHNNTTTSRRRSSNHHHVRVPADEAWLHAMRASSESNISSTSTNTSTSTSSNMDYRTHARSKRNKLEDPVRAAAQAGMLSVEVERMARLLGMDPQVDREFLGIAEAALRAPLPNGWMRHVNSGRDVYVHDVTGKVLHEHPMLEQFRRRFRAAKKARKDIEKLRCEQEAQRQMLR